MWIREWKCRCPIDTADDFIHYLDQTGVSDTQSIEGCTGHKVMCRSLNGEMEIMLNTYWQSLDAMKAYAGDDIYKAVLYPDDYKYRIEPDTKVRVYEVNSIEEGH